MSERLQFMKAMSYGSGERKPHRYSMTVEEIEEMDAARARGEISPLEYKYPSLADLCAKAGRYGKTAYDYLQANNFPKFMRMYADFTLWEALADIPDRVEALKDRLWAKYQKPQTRDPLEQIAARRAYDQMIEETVFEEIIKPFADGE